MLFCKASAPIRKTGPWQAAAYAILLLPWFGAACPALAGNMGDPSEPMRRTAAAYPEYFGPTNDPPPEQAPRRVQRCKNPRWLAATDWNCKRR
jgi:hypothetical protein